MPIKQCVCVVCMYDGVCTVYVYIYIYIYIYISIRAVHRFKYLIAINQMIVMS